MTPEEIKRMEEILEIYADPERRIGMRIDLELFIKILRQVLLLEKSGLVEAALFCLENSHRNGPAVLSKALTAWEEGK